MPQIFSVEKGASEPRKKLRSGLVPTALEFSPGKSALIRFSDGSEAEATCLRCPGSPCMLFNEKEIVSASLPDFPADKNPSVCPSGAITRSNGGPPVIDSDSCMLCGVCASRCPVGAIKMVPYACINDATNPALTSTENDAEADAALEALSGIPRKGAFLTESDEVADELIYRLTSAWSKSGDRFPDHLARSLLVAAGCGAAMRRKGDVFARMDIVLGAPCPEFGCAEAEFGDVAVLDAPRDLLDDLAVSVGRHSKNLKKIAALVVTDVLPNRRSEYWRIVQDIKNVLGVKIGTVTVLSLCLLVWNNRKMSELPPDLFHVDIDTPSYRAAVLEKIAGRKLKIGSDARPHVEVAK